ncbi:unnamed protein product, partial [Mesorhabditis belari]|uniref:Cytochrome b5 n=1 Tax=Mesorhabditis belari TaxID=2138241 RepID=A0AAF3EKA7_9BILA
MSRQITLNEVAEHSTEASIWVIIEGKVYDLTLFLDEHPGGRDVLLEQAGKDATEAFKDVGHSGDAKEMMNDYYVNIFFARFASKMTNTDSISPISSSTTQFPSNGTAEEKMNNNSSLADYLVTRTEKKGQKKRKPAKLTQLLDDDWVVVTDEL